MRKIEQAVTCRGDQADKQRPVLNTSKTAGGLVLCLKSLSGAIWGHPKGPKSDEFGYIKSRSSTVGFNLTSKYFSIISTLNVIIHTNGESTELVPSQTQCLIKMTLKKKKYEELFFPSVLMDSVFVHLSPEYICLEDTLLHAVRADGMRKKDLCSQVRK